MRFCWIEDLEKHFEGNAVDENMNSSTLDTPEEETWQEFTNSNEQMLQEEQQGHLDLLKGEQVSHEFSS